MTFDEILTEHNIAFKRAGEHHHCREGWIQIDCPFCGAGTEKFHLGYNLVNRYLNCWSCGPHKPVETLMELAKLPWRECVRLIRGTADEDYVTEKKLQTGRLTLPKGVGKLHRAHKLYLRERGHDAVQVERLWRIRGIGLAPRLAWRIFIPIYLHGEVVSWTTRSVADSGLRYVSAAASQESRNHKELLYGEDYCVHAIVVCEGPFDVWRLGPGAVATLGTGYSSAQVLRMSRYPVRAVCFDAEPAAQKRAGELCDQLEAFPGETFNITLQRGDVDTANQSELDEIRKRFLKTTRSLT